MKSRKSYSNCLHIKNPAYVSLIDIIITIMIPRLMTVSQSLFFSVHIISVFTQPYDTVIVFSPLYSQGNWSLDSLGTLSMFSLLVSQVLIPGLTDSLDCFQKHRYIQIHTCTLFEIYTITHRLYFLFKYHYTPLCQVFEEIHLNKTLIYKITSLLNSKFKHECLLTPFPWPIDQQLLFTECLLHSKNCMKCHIYFI